MPIYEYRCNACGQRSQIFFRSFSAVGEGRCPHCQSTEISRIPSRVATVKAESSYQDFLSDPSSYEGINYNDPQELAQWTRRIGQAAGVEMGDGYEDMVQQIEAGDVPGDLGGDDGPGDF